MAEMKVDTSSPAQHIGTALTQGTTTGVWDLGCVKKDHIIYIKYSTLPTAPSIQLQGSLNGTDWYNLGAAYTATTSGITAVPNAPTQFLRATVGGTTVNTADIWVGSC